MHSPPWGRGGGGCFRKPRRRGDGAQYACEIASAYSGMVVSGVACTWRSGAGASWTCTGGVSAG